MHGYISKDIQNSQYRTLAPNLWKQYFRMFELHEIMRQRETKDFAEILNRLRESVTPDSGVVIVLLLFCSLGYLC